jgi:hypothetical protein
MSNAQFIDIVRQYGSATRRKHVSYAEAVHRFAQERADSIVSNTEDVNVRTRLLQDMQAIIAREYAPFDPSFVVMSYD